MTAATELSPERPGGRSTSWPTWPRGFRFLLDLTPDGPAGGAPAVRGRRDSRPTFRYRELEDDPAVAAKRLDEIRVEQVSDPTLASLLAAKHRELRLQLEMLEARGSDAFLALSIELYGSVGATLLATAQDILREVHAPELEEGPWLDAEAVCKAAQAELDRYRAFAPDLESHVEVREGSTGVMVSNGDVLDRADVPGPGRADRGPPAPRGRDPRRHPRQRCPPAAARAGQRAGRARRDPGGPGRAGRAPRRAG